MHRRICGAFVSQSVFAPLMVIPRAAVRQGLPRHHRRNRQSGGGRASTATRTSRDNEAAPTEKRTLSVDETEQLQDFLVSLAEALHDDEERALSGEALPALKQLEPTKSVKEELAHVTHSQKVLSELSADALAQMLDGDDDDDGDGAVATSSALASSPRAVTHSVAHSTKPSPLTVTESLLQRMREGSTLPLADNLVLLMQLCARGSELTRGFPLASQELLHGTDLKAVLPTGILSRLYLKDVHLTHMDSTAVRWESVTARRCAFNQSIFYKAHFENCTFYHCCFDSCVCKGLRLSGTVKFVDCSFAFANLALQADTRATVIFKNCDFDLGDFTGSSGLSAPSSFVNCANIKTAASFPLRARQ